MKKGQGWTKDQIEYLIIHYPIERAEDIAVVVGKTRGGVQHKAHYLGIGKDPEGFFKVRSNAMSGIHSGNFNGYRRKTSKGYIARYVPDHPMASTNGLVMEHRLIIEESLGHYLPPEFDVHHINGIKDDNRLENLAVMTHKAHTIYHNRNGRKNHE